MVYSDPVAPTLRGLGLAGASLALVFMSTDVARAQTDLALGRPVTASSSEAPGTTPNLAVDGNAGTRWSSAFSDPQWISVDLGATVAITRVRLNWEAAFGRAYEVQVSTSNTAWTTIAST